MTRFQLFRLTIAAMTAWSTALTATIGAEITRLRGDRSAQWVADRTRELGHPVSRTTVWEIETGRKKSVAVSELLVIARALGVPPTLLLFPSPPDTTVEFLPGAKLPAALAEQWFTGETEVEMPEGSGPSREGDPKLFGAKTLARHSHALMRARRRWVREERLTQNAAHHGASQKEFHARLTRLDEAHQDLAIAEEVVRNQGGVVRDDWLELGYTRPEDLR